MNCWKKVSNQLETLGPFDRPQSLLVIGILYRYAMRDHIVSVNPASFVEKPSVRTRKAAEERLAPEQLAVSLPITGRTRIAFRLAAATGMREGATIRPSLARRGP